MWMSILVKALTSNTAKMLIGMLIRKLLESKSDGVTKDVAEAMLDGIAQSRANGIPSNAFDKLKEYL